MTKRAAPYRHEDGGNCWTKNCSRGNFFVGQSAPVFTLTDFYSDAATAPDADAVDLDYLRTLLDADAKPAKTSSSTLTATPGSGMNYVIHSQSGAEVNGRYEFRNRLPERYDPARHAPVRNPGAEVSWVKPRGGFWLSTLQGNKASSWDNFLRRAAHASIEHSVKFAPEAKVLVINSREDYMAALDAYPHRAELNLPEEMLSWFPTSAISQLKEDGSAKRGLHWENLAKDYDAVLLTREGLNRCGGGDYMHEDHPDDISLYVWDVESAIVFHPQAVVVDPK